MWLQASRQDTTGMAEAAPGNVPGRREQPPEAGDGAVHRRVEPGAANPAAKASDPQPEANHAIPLSVLPAWKMGLVVTASALCGGIAVVLWNRRLLTRMRELAPAPQEDLQGRLWEDDL